MGPPRHFPEGRQPPLFCHVVAFLRQYPKSPADTRARTRSVEQCPQRSSLLVGEGCHDRPRAFRNPQTPEHILLRVFPKIKPGWESLDDSEVVSDVDRGPMVTSRGVECMAFILRHCLSEGKQRTLARAQ